MKKFFKKICSLEIILGLIIISLGVVVSNAGAASLVSIDGQSVIIHDVNNNSFRAVCMIDQALSSCDINVLVYTDAQGTNPATFNLTETNWKSDGIVQIGVAGLQAGTNYYVKINMTVNGSAAIDYPQAAPYLSVKTEVSPQEGDTFPLADQSIYFTTYSPTMDEVAAEDVYVMVGIEGVNYPVAGSENSWQHLDEDFGIYDSIVKLIGYVYGPDGKYKAISGTPNVTIYCLGGINQGYKVIKNIAWNPNVETEGFPDMPDGLDEWGTNYILIAPQAADQPPAVTIKPSSLRFINNQYVMKPGEAFSLDVAANDPDGDSISGWNLQGAPNGMSITAQADPAEAKITWNPAAGDVSQAPYTVTVEASNVKTGTKTFAVLVTEGIPSAPTSVVISPASPKTGDTLTCTVTGGLDPLGDPVTQNYTWFKNGVAQSITGSTVSSSLTSKGDAWSCSVTVSDTPFDGESPAKASNTVTIGNTAPSGNPTVSVSPANPTTNSDLVATVSISGCTDADTSDTLGYTVKWYKNNQETNNTTETLSAGKIKKGESWICKATLTENSTATSNIGTSNSLTIGNVSPSAPGSISIAKTVDGITCTIGQAATDPDAADGVDTIKYLYKWTCTVNGVDQAPVTKGPTTELSQKLDSVLAKNQTWRCEVAATDDNGATYTAFVRNPADQDVTIVNNPPTKPAASLTPASPYKNSSLVCSVTSPSTDPDGDSVQYTFEWFKDSDATPVYTQAASSSTTSTLPSTVALAQGSQYTCKVIASDGQTSGPAFTATAITIGNRAPTLTIKKNGQVVETNQVSVNEDETLTLEVTGADADNNTLTCSALTLPDGATFTGNLFSWTTAIGSAGLYAATFKVVETDGKPSNLSVTRDIQIQVIYPSQIVEDFEYLALFPKPEDNGWFRLQGQGQMSVLSETLQDSTTNHYLKTVTSHADPNTVSATGQLQYIATKWLNNPLDTRNFPELQFTIADRNLYYVEVCIHAIDNNGQGKNYFLRYIPQDPPISAEFSVNGLYINWYLGSQFIDSAGKQVTRNMEKDLNRAIAATQQGYQVHYDYLMGIVLRGDIDRFDNVAVAVGSRDLNPPKDVQNLTAIAKDKAVVLSWTLPANQDPDIIGYMVETVGTRVDKVLATATTCTISGLINNRDYEFKVKAYDNAPVKDSSDKITGNVSPGVSIQTQPRPDHTPPTWPANAFTATPQNKAVILSWTAPSDGDLDIFEIFRNGVSVEVVGKAVTSYRVTGLENNRSYTFTIRAYDNATPRNYSEISATATPETPAEIAVDDFEYSGTGTPTDNGWFRLQGTGSINRVAEGSNSYMSLVPTSSKKLNFIAVKWISNPEECNNPELHFDLKSNGTCSIEFYVLASNGNRYFLSYQPDVTKDFDYCPTPDKIRQGLYITHYLGWKGKDQNSNWRTVIRNLTKDIQDAQGLENVTFMYLLGITIRGECSIDNIRLEKAVPDVTSLVARPLDGSTELCWTSADPTVAEFRLSVDGNMPIAISPSLISNTTNEYSYLVSGLTNNVSHTFKVMQVMQDGSESNGVEVSAIPRNATFTDGCSDLGTWAEKTAQLGEVSSVYDTDVHSKVISIIPNTDAVSIYEVEKTLMTSGSTITLNIKANSQFTLWFKVRDSYAVEYNLIYATGGTEYSGGSFATLAYSYLGPFYTDGQWHTLTINLSDMMQVYFNNSGLNQIESVTITGDVRVDDLTVY
ncbi:MAG: fibronectin type III domain-containing protein [bacterium]